MLKNVLKIDIVIVNWNGGKMLFDCVQSLLQSDYQDYTIHIMDNGSNDNSCSTLPINDKIKIHFLNKNLGFGKACNEALQYCKGAFILLLNPDAVIKQDTLQKAIDFLSKNDYAVYGAAQVGESGVIMKTCGRYPNFFTFCNDVLGLYHLNNKLFKNGFIQYDWSHNISQSVPHVMGSFYLIKRSLTNSLGLFDDRYFVYMEDLDLSLKVTKAGCNIYYDRDNVIYHKGGGVSEQVKAIRLYYILHAKYIFIKKHFNKLSFLASAFVLIFISPIARFLFSLLVKHSFTQVKECLIGYGKFYKYLFVGKV
jgi:GT2 family glycosyltransferase